MDDANVVDLKKAKKKERFTQRFEEIKPQLAEYEKSKISREEYGTGVGKLVPLALTSTSGGRAAAGVLLSTYNCYEFHLDVLDLCVLDLGHYLAAMAVIRGRVELGTEPQKMIENGEKVFGEIWDQWEGLMIINRAKSIGS